MLPNEISSEKRVLVVDDDEAICQVVEMALTQADYQVQIAMKMSDAIQAVLRFKPDVVLLDYRMPDGGGPAFLAHLEQIGVKVSVVLTSAMQELDQLASDLRLHKVLKKPFTLDQLYQAVESR